MLRVEQREQAGVHVVELHGEAGTAEAWELAEVVAKLVEQRPAKLVFDLTGLTFISSLALGELINLSNKVALFNMRVALAGMPPKIQDVLRLIKFEQFYEMYPSLDVATTAMNA